ncbi:hypothetical protein SAMN04489740_2676 [Arthrobacter alpinus]|uniref:SGNH hydrolase-type esterase domain-containing protein n=1 Tax=Arthrobacter alpinus TaxID=656366 RepID=A0A1H5LYS5_9MICC|nr:SGNH/GDSL hydrolase family protein [Arthrobacter alpinus]SEE82229.1 hypothetical protein SAMN04489740_2676 [Arthrobacter alpinus]
MPAPYTFTQMFAVDPNNSENVAKGGTILLYAPGDPTKTPVTITDISGSLTIANPVAINANGFGPAFRHATLDQVAWDGGGFTGTFESYRGMKDAAESSAAAANASAGAADASAGAAALAATNAAGEVAETLAGVAADADASRVAAQTAATNAANAVAEQLASTVAQAEAAKAAAQAAAGLVGAPAGSAVIAAIGPGGAAEVVLTAAIVDGVALDRPSEGQGLKKSADGATKTIALTGHSLLYGQDVSASGTTPATNGATQARSSTPTTVAFESQATLNNPSAVSVINQSYPGDQTKQALTRWVAGQSGDVELFWLDTNDAMDYGNRGGILTDAQTLANFRALIDRANARGAEVIVVGGSPVTTTAHARRIFAAAAADRATALRYGARYVDIAELVQGLPELDAYWTDGIHGTPAFYGTVGRRLAALTGPKGAYPIRVAPGMKYVARQRAHVGGTHSTLTGSATGQTIAVIAGQTLTLAIDVQAPVTPVLKLYMYRAEEGFGTFEIIYNGGALGKATKRVTLTAPPTASGNHWAYVPLHEYRGLGPDNITITCTAGRIEIDAITFVAVRPSQPAAISQKYKALALHPVGGVANRFSLTGSDAMIDTLSGVSLRDGATKIPARWMFEATLGTGADGPMLAQSVSDNSALIRYGYLALRNGANLILRTFDSATSIVDQVITGVFPATGTVRTMIEIDYDATTNALKVYIDGTLKGQFTDTAATWLMAGLHAATGQAYCAATGSVYSDAA